MAQVTNNFLKGKMNKDLDARLLQPGEYRNAVNAQVSKSEGANVGSLENVLGNTLIYDWNKELSVTGLKSIGYLTDEINNTMYIFLTNHQVEKYDFGAKNFIVSYNSLSQNTTVLVEGAFLNFSQLYPIYGVNILEGLLFFTDNRNQPRKINVTNPLGYYTTEDQISVAKYNPYQAIEFWRETISGGEYETTMQDVSSKAYPDGGYARGMQANSTTIKITESTLTGNIPIGGTLAYIDPTTKALVPVPATIISAVSAVDIPTGTRDVTVDINLPTNPSFDVEWVFSYNPYYEDDFSGDSEFLKDKFVRFSYRFKFDDNEYSIFAPFTQPMFIPEQDGYFRYNKDTGSDTVNVEDEEDTYRSTIVDFMENKVTKTELRIPLPFEKDEIGNDLNIISIDILYKESDALAVKVVDSILIADIAAQLGDKFIFTYDYNSRKPYKTLPSDEITRVFDKVPVKALAQEISSNRIIYGNFQTKHTPPDTINYNVRVTQKENFDITLGSDNPVLRTVSKVEYPSSSLKQNRTYQVGVVLSDRFGRQSTVVLSELDTTIAINNENYVGSTVFSEYLNPDVLQGSFPGNALSVLFNSPISPSTPNSNTGWPGIYNGDTTSSDYNPLGWFSFKIVVKQQEQEYYNVYLPGVMAAYPEDSTLEIGKTSHTVLINDNINKVPRDLSEVGPTQKQFRSSVQLYGRVENENSDLAYQSNKPYYPSKKGSIVSTIAGNNDLFNGDNVAEYIPSNEFYSIDSDPLIARISTIKQFGVIEENLTTTLTLAAANTDTLTIDTLSGLQIGDRINGIGVLAGTVIVEVVSATSIKVNKNQTLANTTELTFFSSQPITNVQNLAIFETEPVLSELDIFWESTTSGLISDLNTAIITGDTNSAANLNGFNSDNFNEAIVPGISNGGSSPLLGNGDFELIDSFGQSIAYADGVLELVSVVDFLQNPRESEFTFNDLGTGFYNISVDGNATHPYYVYNTPIEEIQFTFTFKSLSTSGVENFFTRVVALVNLTPDILETCPINVSITNDNGAAYIDPVTTLHAINGSAWPTNKIVGINQLVGLGSGSGWGLVSPPTAFDAAGVPYFSLTSPESVNDYQGSGDTVSEVNIVVNSNSFLNTIPNKTYDLKVSVRDAGNIDVLCTVNITVDNTVCINYELQLDEEDPGTNQPYNIELNYVDCAGESVNVPNFGVTNNDVNTQCAQGVPTWKYFDYLGIEFTGNMNTIASEQNCDGGGGGGPVNEGIIINP